MWMERLCDATWLSCRSVSHGLGRNESSAAHNYGVDNWKHLQFKEVEAATSQYCGVRNSGGEACLWTAGLGHEGA
jgi:hypothetical protein